MSVIVTLTQAQAVWLQTLVASAHTMPLDRRHRMLNAATWRALVEAMNTAAQEVST